MLYPLKPLSCTCSSILVSPQVTVLILNGLLLLLSSCLHNLDLKLLASKSHDRTTRATSVVFIGVFEGIIRAVGVDYSLGFVFLVLFVLVGVQIKVFNDIDAFADDASAVPHLDF